MSNWFNGSQTITEVELRRAWPVLRLMTFPPFIHWFFTSSPLSTVFLRLASLQFSFLLYISTSSPSSLISSVLIIYTQKWKYEPKFPKTNFESSLFFFFSPGRHLELVRREDDFNAQCNFGEIPINQWAEIFKKWYKPYQLFHHWNIPVNHVSLPPRIYCKKFLSDWLFFSLSVSFSLWMRVFVCKVLEKFNVIYKTIWKQSPTLKCFTDEGFSLSKK